MKPVQLIIDTASAWRRDRATHLAAELSFYAVFALPPLFLIALAVAGLFVDRSVVEQELIQSISILVGAGPAATLGKLISATELTPSSSLAAIAGVLVLLFAATRMLSTLRYALDSVWNIQPKPGRPIRIRIWTEVLFLLLVVGGGCILLLSLLLSVVLGRIAGYIDALLPWSVALLPIVNLAVLFLVFLLIFALVYKYVSDSVIAWRDVLFGSVITTVLFVFGEALVGWYLSVSRVTSAYGVAGSILVFLLWIYYSSQIFFLGAEFTKVYADSRGSRIEPGPHAVYAHEAHRYDRRPGLFTKGAIAAKTVLFELKLLRRIQRTKKRTGKFLSWFRRS